MSEEEAKEGKVTSEDFMISITSLSLYYSHYSTLLLL